MRVEIYSDGDGRYFVLTEKDAWEQAKGEDAPWRFENFLSRCVEINEAEDVEWRRLERLMSKAIAEYDNYIHNMGRDPRVPEPYSEAVNPVLSAKPLLGEVDPELERLLAEEDEIDRAHGVPVRAPACMKHLNGSSCILRGDHPTHMDQYARQWKDTEG